MTNGATLPLKAPSTGASHEASNIERAAREALRLVVDPCSIAAGVPIDVVDMGIVKSVEADATDVRIVLRPTSPFCFQLDLITQAIEKKVGSATGRHVSVEVEIVDDWVPEMMSPAARARLRAVRPARADQQV